MSSTIDKAVDYAILNRTALISLKTRALDVTPRTLSRRLNRGFTRWEGHTSQQSLSPGQEEMLVD
jgi:hypothetical protein